MKKTFTIAAMLALSLGAAAAPAPATLPGHSSTAPDCGCVANPGPHQMTMAQAKREATPDVVSLFTAVSEGDEATFARLIGQVGDVNDFLVEDDK